MSSSNEQTKNFSETTNTKIKDITKIKVEQNNENNKFKLKEKILPKRLNKFFYPEKPKILDRLIKPNFALGILLGFSINYYFRFFEIYEYLKDKDNILDVELRQIKKEIKEINDNKKID